MNLGLVETHFVWPIRTIWTKWLVSQFILSFFFFFLFLWMFLDCWHCFVILFYFICRESNSQYFCLFIFCNTFISKDMPLSFQMNIDKDLLENAISWNDSVLYNFMNDFSQLMRDNNVTPWRGAREKTFIILPSFDWLSKPKDTVADLMTSTLRN